MTAQDLIKIAKAEIGTKESPPNSNNVKYNTWLYGKTVSGSGYPWCAAFVSWCFKNTGLCPKTASCLNMLEHFERKGQIVKTPQMGDIVFFKYSTNNRRTNHVGIVVSVSGRIINTIEGNTSVTSQDNGGCVMQRNRSSNIVAYARPNYDGTLTAKPTPTNKREVLRVGSKGNDVLYLHKQLKKLKYGVDVNSNYFDSTTKLCVMNLQASNDLTPNGVVCDKTWKVVDMIQ